MSSVFLKYEGMMQYPKEGYLQVTSDKNQGFIEKLDAIQYDYNDLEGKKVSFSGQNCAKIGSDSFDCTPWAIAALEDRCFSVLTLL